MDIQEAILQAVDIAINEKLKSLKFNYYVDGLIKTNNGNDTYDVEINSEIYTLKARQGLSLSVNNIVKICVINANWSDKFIDMVRI